MTEYGCKVCRVLAERDLEGLNDELVARWTGTADERMGYRRLADWLNTAMLRRELAVVGLPTGGGEARSRYERLQDEGTAPAVRRLLREAGVAVDALTDDFVSYGVVRTHLVDCLEAEREPSPPSDWEGARLEQLTAYAESEAADAVRSLVNKERLDAGGTVEVSATLTVTCSACGVSTPVDAALSDGRFCDCSTAENV